MRYETFKFIMSNKGKYLYNDAAGTGNDLSNDPSAKYIDPNNYLAPEVGKPGIVKILLVIALALVIIFLIKNIIK